MANSKRSVMCLLLRSGFRLATLPDWCSAAEMVVLVEDSPISTEELWSSVRVTIRFSVTSLNKALLPRLFSLAGRPALGRVLVVPNFFNLRMMEAIVFLGTFIAAEICWYPSPDLRLDTILSLHYTDNSFRPQGLVFALTCNVNCGTLHRQVCDFPNHIQSIEFTTGGLQSSCRNISRMINGTGCT